MTQEVQVILTLEVDVTQSKQDIENFIRCDQGDPVHLTL